MHCFRRLRRLGRPGLAAVSLSLGGGVGGGLAAVAAGASLTACPGTATPTGYVPIPGVTLNLGDVLGSLRCGTGPGQVYKYTVVVFDAVDGGPGSAPIASNVWDCFSQAVFDNLSSDAGSSTFFLRIYAYSYAGALAAQGSAVGDAGGEDPIDNAFWCQGGLGAGGATCSFQNPGVAVSRGSSAQWMAGCAATEPVGAPITALCGPLEPVGTASADASAEASADATADAADASADSGEGGSPESSTDTGASETGAPEASASDSGSSESSAPDSSAEGGD